MVVEFAVENWQIIGKKILVNIIMLVVVVAAEIKN